MPGEDTIPDPKKSEKDNLKSRYMFSMEIMREAQSISEEISKIIDKLTQEGHFFFGNILTDAMIQIYTKKNEVTAKILKGKDAVFYE